MRATLRSTRGITLVELLVALAIFATVLALVSAGIVQALRLQTINEATTSLQAKLRRVSEVVAQDLRSAVFGGITIHPYPSGSQQVSFALAQGGQGFTVVEAAGGFTNAGSVIVIAASNPGLSDQRGLMINAAGSGLAFTAGTVSESGDPSEQRWVVPLEGGCTIPMAYSEPVRLFAVDSVGYAFDAASGTLMRNSMSTGSALEVAFDLSGFDVEYVYEAAGVPPRIESQPLTTGSTPLRIAEVGSSTYTLTALRVTIAAEERVSGRMIERTYVSQIPLPAGGNVNLRSVVSCQ